jgi:hypothetical protein
MIKPSLVISTLLLFSASIANAATTSAEPGAQGAASVQKNLDANKSKGKADKGLTNAEAHITAQHGKAHEGGIEGSPDRAPEHPAKPDRIERPAKPERPGR